MEEKIKEPIDIIKAITEEYKDMLKDYETAPLVNVNTGKTTGYGIILTVNTKYSYDVDTLSYLKEKFGADELYVKCKRGQMLVTLKVREFEPSEAHINKMAHAIGLDNVRPQKGTAYDAYRNSCWYSEPDEMWDELVVAGYAKDRRAKNEYRYHVTPKGLMLLARHFGLMIRETHEYDGITNNE